jgi:hypothetical protein
MNSRLRWRSLTRVWTWPVSGSVCKILAAHEVKPHKAAVGAQARWRICAPLDRPTRNRWFADSLLEENGFEPSVPEKARLKGSGPLKVLPGLRYAGGPLERATFGFPCGAENPVICLHRHAPLPS